MSRGLRLAGFDIGALVERHTVNGALPISDDVRRRNPGVDFSALKKTGNKDKKKMFLDAWKAHSGKDFKPEPEFNFSGRFRFDWAFSDVKIAVEVDGGNMMVRRVTKGRNAGRLIPVGGHVQESDYKKLNRAASLGWLVFRFTPGMLKKDPRGCVETVLKAIN